MIDANTQLATAKNTHHHSAIFEQRGKQFLLSCMDTGVTLVDDGHKNPDRALACLKDALNAKCRADDTGHEKPHRHHLPDEELRED